MQPVDWMLILQQNFSAGDAQLFVKAFIHDPLVIQVMHQEGYIERVSNQDGLWNLADLALVAMGSPLKSADLKAPEMMAIDAGLRGNALQLYEQTHKTLMPPANLAEAGQLAIALRERRRLTNGWHGLMGELTQGSLKDQPGLAFQIWRTPLACLFHMIPDGVELCQALLPRQSVHPGADWITHIILSNPMRAIDRIQMLTGLMRKITPERQIGWLRELNLCGEHDMVIEISGYLLETTSVVSENHQPILVKGSKHSDDVVKETLRLQHLAELYRLNGQIEEAVKLFQQVQAVTQTWLARVNVQLADISLDSGNDEEAQKIIDSNQYLHQVELDSSIELIVSRDNPQEEGVFSKSLFSKSQNPLRMILEGLELSKQGEIITGQELARQAVQIWLDEQKIGSSIIDMQIAVTWKPEIFVKALIALDLESEAELFAKKVLSSRPTDEVVAEILIDLYLNQGRIAEALEIAAIQASLHPDMAGHQRILAKLLVQTLRWPEAYRQWKKTLSLVHTPQIEDWLGLAEASLEVGELPVTIEMCQKVLEKDETQGQANNILGRALVKTGQFREAVPILTTATAICPESTQAWLDLAEAYRNLGENHKGLETLRAASLAVAGSAAIQLALGESCDQAGYPAEALPAFRKAFELDPESHVTALRLAQTLFSLGHLSEAQSVLINAMKCWPENPDLAYIYANTSLAIGDREAALQALEIAILTDQPEIKRYILLAETLLEAYRPGSTGEIDRKPYHLDRANQVLETALTWMPDHTMGLILYGEFLLARGENQEAYNIFSQLAGNKSVNDPNEKCRIFGGLGLAALHIGQAELAMETLQDAVLIQPEQEGLQRLIAEAFFQANQRSEAILKARNVVKMSPNDAGNLLWFADFMAKVDEIAEAISTMQVITQLMPEKPELWLKRAGLEVENGDREAAQQSLQTMLRLEGLKHEDYRLAALTYLRMQDKTAAMACLDLASENSSEGSPENLLEMTCLNFRLGRNEYALESCLKLTKTLPNDGILQVLQADILCNLEHWQQALSCLDRALETWEKGRQTGELGRWQRLVNSGWIRKDWLASANRLGMISLRKAIIYQRISEVDLAQQHIELSLQQLENNTASIIFAVELALSQNDLDRCTLLLKNATTDEVGLKSLLIENNQLCGEKNRAAELLRESMIEYPRDFRLRILQVRQLNQIFDWSAANSLFDRLLTDYKERKNKEPQWSMVHSELIASLNQRGDLLRLVDLALDMRRWQNALELASECVRTYGDSAAYLRMAKVIVICAEKQRLYSELNIVAHAPGVEALSDDRNHQFEMAMEKAGLQTFQVENLRWLRRGRLAYDGNFEHLANLANIAENPEDCAALIAALRRNKNSEGVGELANQFSQEPSVLTELALAEMTKSNEEALVAAQHLAEISPSDPVHLAILSMVAYKNEDWTIALGALENALQIWPEEAEWHAWAAEMAEKVNAGRACQAHWEQAVILQPNRLGFALALGRTYNNHQIYNKATSVLRRAIEITDQHPEIWIEMARALQGTGDYLEALECSGKAADLLPEEIRPLLLSGEIAIALGKLDWAYSYAQEAYKIANRDEKVILFLARVMEKRGKPAEGLALIEKVLASGDPVESLVFEQARLLKKIHGPKAALPVLTRLAQENSSSVEALSLLAQVQADCGDMISAEKTARKALETNPNDPEINLLLGRLLYKAGQLDQSIVYLKLATVSGDKTLEALMELGRVYQARREFQTAIQVYQQAIMLSPKSHQPYLAAGSVLREAKDYRGSEAMFRRAAELAPEDVNIQRQLGAVVALNLVYETQEVKFSYGQQ